MDAPSHTGRAQPAMEDTLNATLTDLTENKGAKGVLVTDHEGLCLTARGTLEAGNAARFTSIVDNASKLGGGEEPPTITIDTDKSTIVVVSKDGFITAVCK